MRAGRFRWGAILGGLVILVASLPAAAGQDVSGSDDFDLPNAFAEFWASEAVAEMEEVVKRQVVEYNMDPRLGIDLLGDAEFSSGEEPGLDLAAERDIVEVDVALTDLPSEFFLPQDESGAFCGVVDGPSPESPLETICPESYDPSAFGNGALVVTMRTAGPFPQFVNLALTCEWVVWLQEDSGPLFEPMDQYPLDPARDTNRAFGFRTGRDVYGAFSLDLQEGGFFDMVPTNTVVGIGEDQISFFIPQDELGGAVPEAVRGYTFCTEGTYQPSDSVADSTDLFIIGEPATLSLVAPPPPSTTSTTATTSTTSTTVAAASSPAADEPDQDPVDQPQGTPSSFPLIPIGVGALVVAVIIWAAAYARTSRTTRERGSTPPPVSAPPEDPDDGRGCDWALYVIDGGTRKLLRPAEGQECCVYEVAISTVVDVHDEAIKGRQDAVSPQGAEASPDDRLRIPDLGWGVGSSVWGWVSARSGPAGRLDWMQGLGDPREQAGRIPDAEPSAQVYQQRTLEEGPELAAHLTHLETTSVQVRLEAGCPNHENTYRLSGQSEVFVQANYECTNGAPGPECPVEFTAAGWAEGMVAGDLNYRVGEEAASDVDEIEPVGERLRRALETSRPLAMTDSHDHATRPRDTFESTKVGSGNSVVRRDDLQVSLLTGVQMDAGTIVPVAVWPNTERVTADIYSDVAHDLKVDATMNRGDCGPDCDGHGACECEPSFELKVEVREARLTVDGEVYDLWRPAGGGSWELV